MEATPSLGVTYEEFHAYHDLMSHKLRVVGTVHVKGGGVAVSLQPHEGPQGINPRDLLLDLVFTVTGESPSRQPVEYEQGWSGEGIDYSSVSILVRDGAAEGPPSLPIEEIS